MVELIRQLALLDFQILYGSQRWRTYLALHATFLSLAEGQLRDQVQMALARSEQIAGQSREGLGAVAGLFGYRLRPELGAAFEMLATLLDATMRGLVVMALSRPTWSRNGRAPRRSGPPAAEIGRCPPSGSPVPPCRSLSPTRHRVGPRAAQTAFGGRLAA